MSKRPCVFYTSAEAKVKHKLFALYESPRINTHVQKLHYVVCFNLQKEKDTPLAALYVYSKTAKEELNKQRIKLLADFSAPELADFLNRHTTPPSREVARLLQEGVLGLRRAIARNGPPHKRRPAAARRLCRCNLQTAQVRLKPVSGHSLDPSSDVEVEILRVLVDHPIGAFVDR
jgi:hypothetical protein